MPPRTVYRFDLVAKTCAPWRSACSSSTPATEVCDDRRCRYGGAGGVSLPQPGKHLHDVSREVVLSLPDRIERADHGSIGTRQSFSWNTGTELPPEAERKSRHGGRRTARGLCGRMVVSNRRSRLARR